MLGHGWVEVVHPDAHHRVLEAWNRAVRRHEPFTWDCRLRCHDGAYRWFVARGVVMPAVDAQLEAWFGYSTDS